MRRATTPPTSGSHECFAYGTWRLAPPCEDLDEFVRIVMESWRGAGGEPNIGLELPAWLEAAGFEITAVRPLIDVIDVIDPSSPIWPWPRAFVQSGLRRLVELERLDSRRADAMWRTFERRERTPHTRMITPGALEIVAVSAA